jgi:cholesterol transport system auxiliary component
VRRTRSAPVVLALTSVVSGCSFGLRSNLPPVESYVLRADAPDGGAPTGVAPARASLRVLYPLAAPGLDSERIVLLESDRRLSYYAASRWATPLPALLEQLAVDTLRRTGAWSAVEDSRGVWPADYLLQLDIRRFEADYTGGGPPVVHVVLDCTLGRRAGQDELVASFTTERTVSAAQNRVGAVVEAFERAADDALAEAAQRSRAAVEASRARAN